MEPNHHAPQDTRLYKASMKGDVDTLKHLIREDPLVLTRITPTFFRENPLHIAAMHGHSSYVEELLRHRPPLAEEVDAWGHTALHLASAKGYVATVKVLVQADCRTCLTRNNEWRLPLHLAIMKRNVEVVRELVRAHPKVAREVVDGGQNAAHLCVRCNYLEGLMAIVEELHHHDEEFLASVDEDGNTILHLAAAFKHLKMVEYIIQIMARGDGEMGNGKNKKGQTALDMAENSMPRDLEGLEVTNILINAGIPRAMPAVFIDRGTTVPPNQRQKSNTFRGRIRRGIKKSVAWVLYHDKKWVETMTGWLMIVAILAATVAFQAGVQPPGGVLPDERKDKYDPAMSQPAGSAVAAGSGGFFTYNTYTFLSSLSVIMLLVSGPPLHNKYCVWVLMLLMWATLTFLTLTYSATMHVVNPPPKQVNLTDARFSYVFYQQKDAAGLTIAIWFVVLGGVLLYQLFVMLVWLAILLHRFIVYLRTPSAPIQPHHI